MLEKLKFTLFAIVTLALLGLFGYWAVTTIQTGSDHVNGQQVKKLEKENADLKAQVQAQTEQIASLQSKVALQTTVTPAPDPTPTPTTYKYQSLIDQLQKMIKNGVYLKQKSMGAYVGTVQTFLNIYNNTKSPVDNDFGLTTKNALIKFQKDVGLTSDGTAGITTFSKMIDWLKKQG